MAQRLTKIARALGDHFRGPWGRPPNTGAAVPAC